MFVSYKNRRTSSWACCCCFDEVIFWWGTSPCHLLFGLVFNFFPIMHLILRIIQSCTWFCMWCIPIMHLVCLEGINNTWNSKSRQMTNIMGPANYCFQHISVSNTLFCQVIYSLKKNTVSILAFNYLFNLRLSTCCSRRTPVLTFCYIIFKFHQSKRNCFA